MELTGNEKKIQALYRELKVADELVAPDFIRVWNRARATRPGWPRVFKLRSIVAALAIVVVVIALGSLLLWTQNWRRSQQAGASVVSGPTTAGAMAGATSSPTPAPIATTGPTELVAKVIAKPPLRVRSNRWDRRVAARHQADFSGNAAIREAVSISSWQSPTAMLMQSPADDVLTSLPQLDRSLTELKTFLPDNQQ